MRSMDDVDYLIDIEMVLVDLGYDKTYSLDTWSDNTIQFYEWALRESGQCIF